MKGEVDEIVREHQAGFSQDRSFTDNIASLRIVEEQSIGWNSYLYIDFDDYDKTVDMRIGIHFGKYYDAAACPRN